MQRASKIQTELHETRTIEDLTEVFEGIASMHISKIHSRVVASKEFFAELWQTYAGLRVEPSDRLQRRNAVKGRDVLVAITSEGKLSGNLDERVIRATLDANPTTNVLDIVVVGARGQSILQSAGVKITHTIPMPVSDENIDVGDLINILNEYDNISVFYQSYESLRVQKVTRIELITAVRELSEDVKEDKGGDNVNSHDYIFEPSVNEITDYLESIMMGVALIQIIMETKLSHYANRFNNMNSAKKRANKLVNAYRLGYFRAKRAENDERVKEVLRAGKLSGAST
jgi:ATP synthase F1 gamma subunit